MEYKFVLHCTVEANSLRTAQNKATELLRAAGKEVANAEYLGTIEWPEIAGTQFSCESNEGCYLELVHVES